MDKIDPYKFEAWFSQEGFNPPPSIDADRAIELLGQLREICYINNISNCDNEVITVCVNNKVFGIAYFDQYKSWRGWHHASGQHFILSSLNDLILAINTLNSENIQNRINIMRMVSINNTGFILNSYYGCIRIKNKIMFVTVTHSPHGLEYYILDQNNPDFNRPVFMSKKKKAIINYLIHNISRPVN